MWVIGTARLRGLIPLKSRFSSLFAIFIYEIVFRNLVSRQLFNNMNSGINFDNYESIPVDVSGENTPDPITAVGWIGNFMCSCFVRRWIA